MNVHISIELYIRFFWNFEINLGFGNKYLKLKYLSSVSQKGMFIKVLCFKRA